MLRRLAAVLSLLIGAGIAALGLGLAVAASSIGGGSADLTAVFLWVTVFWFGLFIAGFSLRRVVAH